MTSIRCEILSKTTKMNIFVSFNRVQKEEYDFDWFLRATYGSNGYEFLIPSVEFLDKIHSLRKYKGIDFINQFILKEKKEDTYKHPTVLKNNVALCIEFGLQKEKIMVKEVDNEGEVVITDYLIEE